MESRIVKCVHREDGRIHSIFGRDWGPVEVGVAVQEIEQERGTYAVADTPPNPIIVRVGPYYKHLTTRANPRTNLGDLPEPADRIVTHVHRQGGAIDELVGDDWGPVDKEVAIAEIEQHKRFYAVDDRPLNPIFVVDGSSSKYLRTPPNPLRNLSDLPEPEAE